jgi:hypothetical protein
VQPPAGGGQVQQHTGRQAATQGQEGGAQYH